MKIMVSAVPLAVSDLRWRVSWLLTLVAACTPLIHHTSSENENRKREISNLEGESKPGGRRAAADETALASSPPQVGVMRGR